MKKHYLQCEIQDLLVPSLKEQMKKRTYKGARIGRWGRLFCTSRWMWQVFRGKKRYTADRLLHTGEQTNDQRRVQLRLWVLTFVTAQFEGSYLTERTVPAACLNHSSVRNYLTYQYDYSLKCNFIFHWFNLIIYGRISELYFGGRTLIFAYVIQTIMFLNIIPEEISEEE